MTMLLVACSDAGDDDVQPGETPEGMTLACDGSSLLLAPGMTPAVAVDFIGFRSESTQPRPVTGDAGTNTSEAAWTATMGEDVRGTACSGASDRAACEQKLADLRVLGDECQGIPIVPKDSAGAAPSQPGYCSTSYLVFTRGDENGTVKSLAEAIAFFGTIDAPQEAMYLLRLSGERLLCGGNVPATYRKVDDGYEVQAVGGNPRCVHSGRRILHVSSSGAIRVISSETVTSESCSSSS